MVLPLPIPLEHLLSHRLPYTSPGNGPEWGSATIPPFVFQLRGTGSLYLYLSFHTSYPLLILTWPSCLLEQILYVSFFSPLKFAIANASTCQVQALTCC